MHARREGFYSEVHFNHAMHNGEKARCKRLYNHVATFSNKKRKSH
jgi:hypothetical protein